MLNLSVIHGTTSLDLQSATCLVDGEAVTWGSFPHTARFKRWLARGKKPTDYPYGEWYESAVHTLPVVIKCSVVAVDAIMCPGASLVASDGLTRLLALILSAEREEPVYYADHAEVTYDVTTQMWCESQRSYTATNVTGTCFGVFCPPVVGGDGPALTEHRLASMDASTTFSLAVTPNASGFNPVLNLSGVSNAAAIGGSNATGTNATGTAYAEVASMAFDPTMFGGDCLILPRVKSASAVNWRAKSTVTGSGLLVANETTLASDPSVGTTALKVIPFGPIPVPCADSLYTPSMGTAYGSEEVSIAQDTGTSWLPMGQFSGYQTFTAEKNCQITALSVYVKVASTPLSDAFITLRTTPEGTFLRVALHLSASSTSGEWMRGTISPPLPVDAGTVLYLDFGAQAVNRSGDIIPDASVAYSSSNPYASGAWTSNASNDLRFRVYSEPLRLIGTLVELEANATGAVSCSTDAIMVMPVSSGAVLATLTTSANGGVLIDATSPGTLEGPKVYEYANSGTEDGVGQAKSAEWFGPAPRLLPGDNAVCVAAGVGDLSTAAPSGLRYSVRWVERYLRPYGGA